jgi:phospholipid/cholesterol/gamma-HCH transport system substrate-binding protein
MNIKKTYLETLLGLIVIIIAVFGISHIYKLRSTSKLDSSIKLNTYKAKFSNVEGINIGANIKIGGVNIGEVKDIVIDTTTYQIIVTIRVDEKYPIPSDSILAVSSSGLLGNKYIEIKPGSNDDFLKDEDFFESTLSSISLEDMLSKLAFNLGGNK